MQAAICTRAAYANLRMKRAIVFQLEILRDRAASHAIEIIENLVMKGTADWSWISVCRMRNLMEQRRVTTEIRKVRQAQSERS